MMASKDQIYSDVLNLIDQEIQIIANKKKRSEADRAYLVKVAQTLESKETNIDISWSNGLSDEELIEMWRTSNGNANEETSS